MMSIPPVKMCGVYFLNDQSILIEGINYEPTGPGGLSSGQCCRFSKEFDDLLGIVVLRFLNQTKSIGGREWDEKEATSNLLKFAGMRSTRLLESGAKYIYVQWKELIVTVIPTQSGAYSGRGYAHLTQHSGTCAPNPEAIRELILQKKEQCE